MGYLENKCVNWESSKASQQNVCIWRRAQVVIVSREPLRDEPPFTLALTPTDNLKSPVSLKCVFGLRKLKYPKWSHTDTWNMWSQTDKAPPRDNILELLPRYYCIFLQVLLPSTPLVPCSIIQSQNKKKNDCFFVGVMIDGWKKWETRKQPSNFLQPG